MVMKELIGKVAVKSSNLPKKISVNKVYLFDKKKLFMYTFVYPCKLNVFI